MQPALSKQNPGGEAPGLNQTEPTALHAATPQPQTRPMLGRIGAVLKIVQRLIAYGQHFNANAPARAGNPQFASVNAIFGTYDLATMMFRVKRGTLRAMALQRYLLARAARDRNLRFGWRSHVDLQPHHRPPTKPRAKPTAPRQAPRKEPSLLADDAPGAYYLPTDQEFDAEMRRRPVGRTMAYICLDLSIVPGLCNGDFWCDVEYAMRRYGGSIKPIFDVRLRREKSFQRKRDRLSDTWHIDWRDLSKPTVRHVLGMLIGETPPSSPGPAPVIVPS